MEINNLSFITTLRLQSVTLELGSIERITLTCCLRPPFPCLFQCWPQIKLETIPPKNHYKTTLEERKTGIRAVWPKLSVLDCSLSHRCSLTISEWNCFLYLHELGRAKHRYPARRGFSPVCLYGFIKEVVHVACLSRTYFVYAPAEMWINHATLPQTSHANDFVLKR